MVNVFISLLYTFHLLIPFTNLFISSFIYLFNYHLFFHFLHKFNILFFICFSVLL